MATIRPMQIDDVDTVHRSGLNVQAFHTSAAEATKSPFWPKDRLERWVKKGKDVLLVAEEDDQIVGYFLSHLHTTTGTAYIENLFVKEGYRQQGIGTSLLETGVDRIVDQGGRYISALTKTDNEEMQELLENAGFNRGDTFVWMDLVCE